MAHIEIVNIWREGGLTHFEVEAYESASAKSRGDEPDLQTTWSSNHHERIGQQVNALVIRQNDDEKKTEIKRADTGEWVDHRDWVAEGGLYAQGVKPATVRVVARTRAQWRELVEEKIEKHVAKVMADRRSSKPNAMIRDQRSWRYKPSGSEPAEAQGLVRSKTVSRIVAERPGR